MVPPDRPTSECPESAPVDYLTADDVSDNARSVVLRSPWSSWDGEARMP